MSAPTDGTPTPLEVIALATKHVTLDHTALIGTFGTTTSPGALVRLPDGTFARVTVGDDVAGGKVAAIAEDRIIVSRSGKDMVFALPQG